MKTIKEVLMKRDEITEAQALAQIEEAREQFEVYIEDGDLESAENICNEFFGLEPDYLDEFLY